MGLDTFLQQVQQADLLRLVTAGSVDDGKSTLIGRLLNDAKSIYEDHLAALKADSKKAGREDIDFALLTDGLRAEREQGITIDVAYRHFSTPKRRFIIADTPGNEQYTRNMVTVEDKSKLLGQKPMTLWLTGLSGSGKSTIAYALESRLTKAGRACYVLDGDNVRHGLNRDLGFSAEDRSENIRRVAEVARLMNEAGLIVITAFISPFVKDRQAAREVIGGDRFVEVFVDAPIEVCEQRDPKGLYAKARAGEVAEFTGVSSPYEPPEKPDVRLDTAGRSRDECVDSLLEFIARRIEPLRR